MKLFLSLVYAVLLVSVASVTGKLAVRITFNQGKVESHKFCTASNWISNWIKVQIALDRAAARRLTSSHRHLTFCQDTCRYAKPRTCYLTGFGCRNKCRRANEQEMETALVTEVAPISVQEQSREIEQPLQRQLYLDHECAEKKNRLVNGLNSVQNDVDQNCRNLITSQHDLECFDV